MAISTDPSVLVAASRCYDTCISPGEQSAVKTYLLAQLAGVTDPAVIMTNARCFSSCIPQGAQMDVQSYLSAVLAGGSTDPSTLLNNATCFRSCVPPGGSTAVAIYALAVKAGGTTDAATLANLARCFSSCIPPGMQLAAQSYLLGVQAGLTDPATILTRASSFIHTDPTDPTISDEMITRWIAGGFGTGGGIDPAVNDWVARIERNGLAINQWVSDNTVNIVNTFYTGLKFKTSLFNKMIAMGPCVGDNINAGFCPLIRTPLGTEIWTMTGAYPIIANCDVTINGIRCDFGISVGPDCIPSTIFPSTADTGCTFYQFSNDGAHGPRVWDWGVTTPNEATSQWSGTTSAFGNTYFDCCNAATQFFVAASGLNGYYSWNSTAANARAIYFANSTHPHSAIATSAAVIGGPLPTKEALICGLNNNGSGVAAPSVVASFRAIHHGLTAQESSDLFTLVQAMRVSLGGGFV